MQVSVDRAAECTEQWSQRKKRTAADRDDASANSGPSRRRAGKLSPKAQLVKDYCRKTIYASSAKTRCISSTKMKHVIALYAEYLRLTWRHTRKSTSR